MTRKKKSSPAEDLIAIAALLPWWLSVALALILYVVLHNYAQTPVDIKSVSGPQNLGRLVTGQMVRIFSTIGQYLIPFLLLVGTAVSVIGRRRRVALLNDVSKADNAGALRALHAMSWQQFELAVGQWFRTQGYTVLEQGGGGADGGIDLCLTKDNEQFIVQCKQWRATKVGVTTIRELYGAMAAQGATGGFVITAGTFTRDATAFASGRNLTLIDGAQLAHVIRASTGSKPTLASTATQSQQRPSASGGLRCPLCGMAMVRRTATRGANAGRSFWGCGTYPSCRGTLTA